MTGADDAGSPHLDPAARRPAPRDDVRRIERVELAALLAAEPRPALFEVLPLGYWRKNHLPGALSAPPDEAVAIITAAVPDHDAPIVVYCWDPG